MILFDSQTMLEHAHWAENQLKKLMNIEHYHTQAEDETKSIRNKSNNKKVSVYTVTRTPIEAQILHSD